MEDTFVWWGNFDTFELWCSRRTENIDWTEYVRNEVLQRVKEERNILHTIKRRKVKCLWEMPSKTAYIWKDTEKDRNDGKMKKETKYFLDELIEKRGYRKFRDQTLDGTLWRTRGRSYLPFIEGPRDECV
jgi:hypothetical protein